MTSQCPITSISFDHHVDEDYIANPQKKIRELQDMGPVLRSDAYGGFWVVTGYADIHEVFRTPTLYSSYPVNIPTFSSERPLVPIESDPPHHARFRQMLSPFFSPAHAQGLTDLIREVAVDLVDGLVQKGHCDVNQEFALELPTRIFTHLMGLPMAEAPRFLEWNHRILHGYTTEDAQSDHAAAVAGVFEYFATLLAQRAQDPKDDVVTYLANVTDAEGGLTLDEQLGICFNLFIAGLDTVAATLVFFLDFLARNPAHSQSLREDPSLIPGASEEMLRYHSFVCPGRIATRDTDIRGVPIRKGDRVLLMTGAAGIDEQEFADALTIDFRRKPNRHFGFGAGPHRCIGSHLARRELIVALEVIHTRTRSYRIDPDAEIVRHGGNVGGIDKLMLFVE